MIYHIICECFHFLFQISAQSTHSELVWHCMQISVPRLVLPSGASSGWSATPLISWNTNRSGLDVANMSLRRPNHCRPRGRVPPSPTYFFRDNYEHVGYGELELGIPDLWFKPDIVTPTTFPGQVRSLTYDVTSKPLQGPQNSQIQNAFSPRPALRGRWN